MVDQFKYEHGRRGIKYHIYCKMILLKKKQNTTIRSPKTTLNIRIVSQFFCGVSYLCLKIVVTFYLCILIQQIEYISFSFLYRFILKIAKSIVQFSLHLRGNITKQQQFVQNELKTNMFSCYLPNKQNKTSCDFPKKLL